VDAAGAAESVLRVVGLDEGCVPPDGARRALPVRGDAMRDRAGKVNVGRRRQEKSMHGRGADAPPG
jgi:hypothetical protein